MASGWNGSDRRGSSAPVQPKATAKKPSPMRGVLAGGLVVILVAIVYFAFFAGNEKTRVADKDTGPRKIKEVKPATTREDLAKMIERKTGKKFDVAKKDPEDLGWYTNKLGQVKRRTGKSFVISFPPSKSLFTNPVENQLDGVVNTPLGSNYYDDEVPEDFEEQFAYSLTNRISITENDTPEEAEKKRRVIEAKETLVELKKQGANLREVMLEQKKMMIKKFEDYIFFEQGLNELRAQDASPEEIAEYALAAKTMMKEKDIEEPLTLGIEETEAMEEMEALINPQKKKAAETNEGNPAEQPAEENK